MSRRWEDLLEQVARERYQRLVAHATSVSASPSDAQDSWTYPQDSAEMVLRDDARSIIWECV